MNDAWWTDADGTMHERCKLLFVSTGEMVDFDPGASPETGWMRGSIAYFCAHCGDIWERISLIDSRGVTLPFQVIPCACEKHHDHWHIPGSRLVGRLDGLLPLLPEGVLRREFEVHIQYQLGESQVGTTSLESNGSEGPARRSNGHR